MARCNNNIIIKQIECDSMLLSSYNSCKWKYAIQKYKTCASDLYLLTKQINVYFIAFS